MFFKSWKTFFPSYFAHLSGAIADVKSGESLSTWLSGFSMAFLRDLRSETSSNTHRLRRTPLGLWALRAWTEVIRNVLDKRHQDWVATVCQGFWFNWSPAALDTSYISEASGDDTGMSTHTLSSQELVVMANNSTLGLQRSQRKQREGPHDELDSKRFQPRPLFVHGSGQHRAPSSNYDYQVATSATVCAINLEQVHIGA